MRVSLTESTPILILKPPDSEAAEGDEAAPSWQCWAELNCINESWLWEGLVIAHFSKVRAEARPSLRSGQTRRSRAHVVTARLGQLVWRCRTLYLREQNLPALGCAMNSSGCDESTHHCKVESPCKSCPIRNLQHENATSLNPLATNPMVLVPRICNSVRRSQLTILRDTRTHEERNSATKALLQSKGRRGSTLP